MNGQTKEKVVFVVNPNAGRRKTSRLENLIKKHLDHKKYNHEIIQDQSIEKVNARIENAIKTGASIIVAVGGDGTVNLIGRQLINSNTALAIIPKGSGNGLARHLKIPLNTVRAIQTINDHKVIKMDVGSINDHAFFCAAGTGFDAQVIQYFHRKKNRGLLGYITTSVFLFFNYRPEKYTFQLREKTLEVNAYFISFSNTSQFGNNAYIAPMAKVNDGKLDICVVKDFPFFAVFRLIVQLFTRSLDKSKYVDYYQTNSIIVERKNSAPIHFDGEPAITDKEVRVNIRKNALSVIVP